jgi:hypothetical protein
LISLAVHYVDAARRVVDSFRGLQSGIQPTLRFAIWVTQALNALLPGADLRALSNPSLQTHSSKWSTISRRGDGEMGEKTLKILGV